LGDVLVILNVAGNEGQVMVDGSGSNKQIRLRDESPLRSQIAMNTSKLFGNRISDAKNGRCLEK